MLDYYNGKMGFKLSPKEQVRPGQIEKIIKEGKQIYRDGRIVS